MNDQPQLKRPSAARFDIVMGGRGDAAELSGQVDLVHVTSVGSGRDIISAGKIEARPCKVFGKSLAYFFLSRPAFKSRDSENKSSYIGRFPFVLIGDPETVGNPYHLFPFDSGAFMGGIFGDRPDPSVALHDYELEPSFEDARAHIQWAFGSLAQYYDGDMRARLDESMPQWDQVGHGYLGIARLASSDNNQPDGRAASVEVAYNRPVPLKGAFHFAVIPKQYLHFGRTENRQFMDRLRELGIEWETYDWQASKSPGAYTDEITRIVRAYLSNRSHL